MKPSIFPFSQIDDKPSRAYTYMRIFDALLIAFRKEFSSASPVPILQQHLSSFRFASSVPILLSQACLSKSVKCLSPWFTNNRVAPKGYFLKGTEHGKDANCYLTIGPVRCMQHTERWWLVAFNFFERGQKKLLCSVPFFAHISTLILNRYGGI